MGRRFSLATGVVALVLAAPAGADAPPASLLHAEQQTAHASSVRVSMAMSMRVAGESMRFTASGVERVKAHQASMVVDMSKLNPALGKMKMLAIGSRYYIHYDLLDRLHRTRPQIKPWIVADSVAATGFDPWSLGDVDSIGAASGYKLLGTSGGVSRYSARIDLRSAIASSPQLQQLFQQAGTSLSSVLDKAVPVVLYVGSDGYLNRVVERVTMTIAGESLRMTVDVRLGDFGVDPGPVAAPSPADVMTLAQFKQLANG
jgi:hypothetical protein